MTDKEVKQESLLPSVESIYMKITSHSPLKELSGIPKEWILSKIKEALELTRDKTLEFASEKAKIDENESDLGRISFCVHKGSILSLKTDPKLNVH